MKMWAMKLELTFPILPEDEKVKHEGDTDVDFSFRATMRIKPFLEKFIKEIDGGYYIYEQGRNKLVKKVYE